MRKSLESGLSLAEALTDLVFTAMRDYDGNIEVEEREFEQLES